VQSRFRDISNHLTLIHNIKKTIFNLIATSSSGSHIPEAFEEDIRLLKLSQTPRSIFLIVTASQET
jgi:hypothetical protein